MYNNIRGETFVGSKMEKCTLKYILLQFCVDIFKKDLI